MYYTVKRMEQIITIFANYAKDPDHPRYWVSVSNKGYKDGKETDEYISANLNASLTKDAIAFFKDHSQTTKNEDIDMCLCKLTNGWLKAVEGKEENYVILVCHKLEALEKKEDKKKRR